MTQQQIEIDEQLAGKRLDACLSGVEPFLSRAQVQRAIEQKRVSVNNTSKKASYKLKSGDIIVFQPEEISAPAETEPENIPVDILFQDSYVVVVNKPAGMVVHPGCGNYRGTLVSSLLYHCRDLSGIGGKLRPGIVHRLDKGTSGVMVAAKNDLAHIELSHQFKAHSVFRQYKTLVFGTPHARSGTIDLPIGRDPANRQKMSTRARISKQAVTRWRAMEYFDGLTLMEATLETGRTHQVRVHLSSIGHPVAGDSQYGASGKIKQLSSKQTADLIKGVKRPLLHAGILEFLHPATKAPMCFEVPVPEDFSHVLKQLRQEIRKQ